MLTVLEAIAQHQPVGVSALARLLDANKSAVQRSIMTLADEGWIAVATGPTTRWELTAHIFAVAHMTHSKNDLRRRAHAELEGLRDKTGETAILTVPDAHHFVVVDVHESRQVLRTTSSIGTIAPAPDSATALAVLPFMDDKRRLQILGTEPDSELLDKFRISTEHGYSVSSGGQFEGVTNLAAAIFETDGRPVGAVVITGPTARLTAEHYPRIGALVSEAARNLSRGPRNSLANGQSNRTHIGDLAFDSEGNTIMGDMPQAI